VLVEEAVARVSVFLQAAAGLPAPMVMMCAPLSPIKGRARARDCAGGLMTASFAETWGPTFDRVLSQAADEVENAASPGGDGMRLRAQPRTSVTLIQLTHTYCSPYSVLLYDVPTLTESQVQRAFSSTGQCSTFL
jgi:hypothetical protein